MSELIIDDKITSCVDRVVPHNIEAEQIILGAILINNDVFMYVSDQITVNSFYNKVHGLIFSAIEKLLHRGLVATVTTVKTALTNHDIKSEFDINDYFSQIMNAALLVPDIRTISDIVFNSHLRRKMIDYGSDVVNISYKNDITVSVQDEIESAEQVLFELASTGINTDRVVILSKPLVNAISMIESAYKKRGELRGITTGFVELDKILCGLQKSDLIIIAGRPSMGKTALAINIALNGCKAKTEEGEKSPGVLFFH